MLTATQAPEPTCAALVHNNTRCPKHNQCARAVCWFDDSRADFNLCSVSGRKPGEYRHFLPIAVTAEATLMATKPNPGRQASLF